MKQANLQKIELCKLKPFANHPYKVQDDEEMEALTESIRANGILSPLLVRALSSRPGEYEVISGHRRMHAAEKAGLDTVPAFVTELDVANAVIMMVDSNLHREHLLPSEKAFAYRMKYEAMKHQGRTSGQVGPKLAADEVSNEESGRQVKRYIRLTYLLPELLKLVDEGKIALNPAVEISYLTKEQQGELLTAMELYDCTPSLAQAIRLKRAAQEGSLDEARIDSIMKEEKPNQQEKIRFSREDFGSFFPPRYTNEEIKRDILKGLELLRRQREKSYDAR